MNPVPPLTTILMEFLLSGGAEQTNSLAGCGKTRLIHHTPLESHKCADARISSGCSKRPSSKAAASEEVRRTLRYVEPLSEEKTPLVDFFSILLAHARAFAKYGFYS